MEDMGKMVALLAQQSKHQKTQQNKNENPSSKSRLQI